MPYITAMLTLQVTAAGRTTKKRSTLAAAAAAAAAMTRMMRAQDGAAAEPDMAAKQRALEEARAMLADRPRSKKKRSNTWFEEEVATHPITATPLSLPPQT